MYYIFFKKLFRYVIMLVCMFTLCSCETIKRYPAKSIYIVNIDNLTATSNQDMHVATVVEYIVVPLFKPRYKIKPQAHLLPELNESQKWYAMYTKGDDLILTNDEYKYYFGVEVDIDGKLLSENPTYSLGNLYDDEKIKGVRTYGYRFATSDKQLFEYKGDFIYEVPRLYSLNLKAIKSDVIELESIKAGLFGFSEAVTEDINLSTNKDSFCYHGVKVCYDIISTTKVKFSFKGSGCNVNDDNISVR